MTDLRPASTTAPSPGDARTLRGARRITIIGVIVSVSLAAVVAIISVITGDLSRQSTIILTTLLVTGFGLTMLCHLGVAGRPVRIVGFVGIGVSTVALVLGLMLIWWTWLLNSDFAVDVWRWFGVSVILAVSLAHANLLLLLAGRRHPAVRIALTVTLCAIATLALLGILPILSEGDIPAPGTEDGYSRAAIVIAIIDALGTIVLPVVALFLRDPGAGTTAPDAATAAAAAPAAAASAGPDAPPAPEGTTGDAVEQRIARLEASTGLGRNALLMAALDALEATRAGTRA
uniref:hypothetical protein n=1 Tax=Agromyces humi TaxID=1766800 RepID=UPI00193ACC20